MKIQVPTQKDKYYRQLLEFLRPIKPFSQLNNKDLGVLSGLLTEYMGLKGLTHERRCALVFNTDNRRKVANANGMSDAAFNNTISKLKRVGVIDKKNSLKKSLVTYLAPTKNIIITFV